MNIRENAAGLGFRFTPLEPLLDIEREAPVLASAQSQRTPLLAELLPLLRAELPIPPDNLPATEQHFYRLPNHNRSFCYAISGGEQDVLRAPALVFKGTEPLSEDFETLLEWLAQTPFRRSALVMADHFPLVEGKIPGALSRGEAVREMSICVEVQLKHLQYYGEPAALPVPLFVHNYSREQNQRARAAIERNISRAAFEKIAPALDDGLAVYTYFYRTSPVRANVRGSGGGSRLVEHVERSFAAEAAIEGWIQLFARLLYLGYLPYTPRSKELGACLDFGNATIDGGYCDPDSITPIADCPDDELFYASLAECFQILEKTIAQLTPRTVSHLYSGFEEVCLARWVASAFAAALDREARPGLSLDPRVHRFCAPKSYGDVLRLIERRARPATYSAFVKRRIKR